MTALNKVIGYPDEPANSELKRIRVAADCRKTGVISRSPLRYVQLDMVCADSIRR